MQYLPTCTGGKSPQRYNYNNLYSCMSNIAYAVSTAINPAHNPNTSYNYHQNFKCHLRINYKKIMSN